VYTLCNSIFTIHHGGRHVTEKHTNAIKHNVSLAAKALSRITDSCFVKITTANSEFELAAKEGTFTFHTVTDNRGVRLMGCTSTIIWKLFEPEFTCAQTKFQDTVVNVLAPLIINQIREELEHAKFISIIFDSCNNKHTILAPIPVH
jgi:hypothetical protein